MDPITLIIAGLVQGAASAAKDLVPDAYRKLREMLHKRFAGNSSAEMVLQEFQTDPKTWEAPLRKQLEQISLANDQEILAVARQLLEELGKASQTPTIEIGRGAKGIIGQNVNNATYIENKN